MIIKLPESFFTLGQFCYLCFFSCRRSVSITSYHRPDRDWSVILCALPLPFCLNSAVPPWFLLHENCIRDVFPVAFVICHMIFVADGFAQFFTACVSLRAGTVGGLPNRNSKRLFSRTSNEISKKAVRFSLEVGRCRKAPRHHLFSEFFAKAIKMPGQFVYGGGFQVLLSSHKIPQGIGKR